MANPAAGVTRTSHSSAPTGSTPSSTASRYGSTIPAITAVTAPALRRSSVPTARASTAATASSAAVPTTIRASVRAGTGSIGLPFSCSRCSPSGIAIAAATSPAANVTAGQHDRLGGQHPAAPRAGGERGADQPAPVLGGHEHDADHHQDDQPDERARQGLLDSAQAAAAAVRGDVARPGHGELAAGLGEPLRRRGQGVVRRALDGLAGPPPRRGRGPAALLGHVVEGPGGQGGTAGRGRPAERRRRSPCTRAWRRTGRPARWPAARPA